MTRNRQVRGDCDELEQDRTESWVPGDRDGREMLIAQRQRKMTVGQPSRPASDAELNEKLQRLRHRYNRRGSTPTSSKMRRRSVAGIFAYARIQAAS